MNNNGHFLTQPGLIQLPDGRNWQLDSELKFVLPIGETITVPAGFKTDLASIPPLGFIGGLVMLLGAALIGIAFSGTAQVTLVVCGYGCVIAGFLVCAASPFLKAYGRYTYSAVLHDWIFQTHAYPFTVCNWILLMGMKSENTAWWERSLIWLNVQLFGYAIYRRDRLS
jgi:hypothetical protein